MSINKTGMFEKFKEFDRTNVGRIKIYHLINVLRYNYHQYFNDELLVGLQFELECLNPDHFIDYEEFMKVFMTQKGETTELTMESMPTISRVDEIE